MAITLNGSSQYINLAAGANVYGTRPWTFAALIRRNAINAWHGVFIQGDYLDRGWAIELTNANKIEFQKSGTVGDDSLVSTTAAVDATGWWFIGVVCRDTGASNSIDFYAYRYSTSTLTVSSTTGGTDENPNAPTGADKCLIGAWHDGGTVGDYFNGDFGWVGVFAGDLGNAASTTAPAMWELITRGPWGMLDSNCKLFIPFSGAVQDLSGVGLHGTLNGSPSYVGNGPVEFALPAIIPVTRQPAASGINGVLSITQDNQTIAATGTVLVAGTATLAQTDQTIVAAGTVLVQGTLSKTQDNQTIVATGTVGSNEITGVLNITQDNQTIVAAGTVLVAGILSKTQDNQTLSATGTVGVAGTLSKTQDNQTIVATGTVLVQGTLSKTQDNQTLAATGATQSYKVTDVSAGRGYTDVSPKQVVRTSANRVYLIVNECDAYPYESGDRMIVKKANVTGVPSAFTEFTQTSITDNATIAIEIDSSDVIHVLYYQRTGDLRYRKWDTSTDDWVATAETVDTGLETNTGQGDQMCSLTLDSNGVPHIVYLKTDGTRRRATYRNRVGGTWSSATTLDTASFGSNEKIWHPNIVFDTTGRAVAAWLKGTFNDTADGTIYVRTRETNGTWNTVVQVSASSGALTSIDQSTSLIVTADNRYHTTYINASTTPGNKYIRYRYSDDNGGSWSANDPASGTQATHNPSLGPNGKGGVRIWGHGTPDAGNHGENIYYFDGAGGAAGWSSWTQFVTGTHYDSSVNTRWQQYNFNHPGYLDIAYWDDNYPNVLHYGVEHVAQGAASLTQGNNTLASTVTVLVQGTLAKTQDNNTLVATGVIGSVILGDVNVTQGNNTLAAAGTVLVQGTLAKTQADNTLVATATVLVQGTLAKTQDNNTLSATATQPGAFTATPVEWIVIRPKQQISIPARRRITVKR